MTDLKKILAIVLFVTGLLLLGACSTSIKFKSMAPDNMMLTGYLSKPDGDGPFPAVVMLHGCDGIREHYEPWILRLNEWGYVTFMVDSFGPRNETNLCTPEKNKVIRPLKRGLDAHGAKQYLAGLPFVDPNRISVMGWSHGGSSTLMAVSNYYWDKNIGEPFKAAIAFYPWCYAFSDPPKSPLLILIGEEDDWTPAHRCNNNFLRYVENEVTLIVYPEAHHAFDFDEPLHKYMGHMVGRNNKAAADAEIQVNNFLGKHLK
jgi:dienelactone hydrolase